MIIFIYLKYVYSHLSYNKFWTAPNQKLSLLSWRSLKCTIENLQNLLSMNWQWKKANSVLRNDWNKFENKSFSIIKSLFPAKNVTIVNAFGCS